MRVTIVRRAPLAISLLALVTLGIPAAPAAGARTEVSSVEQVITSPAASQRPPGTGHGSPSEPPAGEVPLSNEWDLTTWAHPLEPVPIYVSPDAHARRIDHVRMETEDGFEEVYMLLASVVDAYGQEWVKLRIPGRPNGRTGWVVREALGGFHRTRWLIVISLHRRELTAYLAGRVRFRAPVGVGKPSTPTPRGRFWIRERFRLANRRNPYWPYALGTSDYSTLTDWPGGGVVGIHGDFGEPRLIPGDPSHGCVRMRDGDIAWLAPRITLGTPVHIE
jgi:L,D-transpeptidase catalytic domain